MRVRRDDLLEHSGWSGISRPSVKVVSMLGVALAVGVFSNELQASVGFCNRTDRVVSLIIAWQTVPLSDSHVARVRGWWSVAPNECKTIVSDLDASKAVIYYYAHSVDTTWGKKIPYETRPDGYNYPRSGIMGSYVYEPVKISGLCVTNEMLDRDIRITRNDDFPPCQRGFYPKGFLRAPFSNVKNQILDLLRQKPEVP